LHAPTIIYVSRTWTLMCSWP